MPGPGSYHRDMHAYTRDQAPATAFGGYRLDERRTDNYTFTSMKGLVRYFKTWLEEEEIAAVIEDSKNGFIVRKGCGPEETKLQMIKKCEYALVRILRKGPR
jgi:hypothetical protein